MSFFSLCLISFFPLIEELGHFFTLLRLFSIDFQDFLLLRLFKFKLLEAPWRIGHSFPPGLAPGKQFGIIDNSLPSTLFFPLKRSFFSKDAFSLLIGGETSSSC